MSNSQTQIDELVLDELVSGNLRGEEYREVLRELDKQPDRWRDCALAFLEHQAFQQDLSALAGSRTPWELETEEALEDTVSLAAPMSDSQRKSASRLEWMHRFTSIAALLLISFTIGWFGSGLRRNIPTGSSPSGQQVVTNEPQVTPQSPVPSNMPSQGFQYAGDPVLQVDRQQHAVLQEMERLGLADIETHEVYMPFQLEDGTTAIVPIQKHNIRPKVYSY